MKEDPHFCFLLPAKEEREACFTSVTSRWICDKDVCSLVSKRIVWGLPRGALHTR